MREACLQIGLPLRPRSVTLRFMLHVIAHARPGTLIFESWNEGLLLWRSLVKRIAFRALVVMPDHLHALVSNDEEKSRLVHGLVGFAQARNALRGESGSVWTEGIEATPVRESRHVQHLVRDLHLKPSRNGLVDDPLAWPLSTHRDCVGLAIPTAREPHEDPHGFHAWVSADPSADAEGTILPAISAHGTARPSLAAIRAAVSALMRVTLGELRRRGAARTLLLRAARELSDAPPREIARFAGVCPSTVRRTFRRKNAGVRLVERVVNDARFFPLQDGDLHLLKRRRPSPHAGDSFQRRP